MILIRWIVANDVSSIDIVKDASVYSRRLFGCFKKVDPTTTAQCAFSYLDLIFLTCTSQLLTRNDRVNCGSRFFGGSINVGQRREDYQGKIGISLRTGVIDGFRGNCSIINWR